LKVYIAAPWVYREAARAASLLFEAAGHTITERWWEHEEMPGGKAGTYAFVNDIPSSSPEARSQSEKDLDGVYNADRFVLLNLGPSEGKMFECAIAWQSGIPVIGVGGRTHIFHFLPRMTWVPTVEGALELMV
jgi:hypothetical protein